MSARRIYNEIQLWRMNWQQVESFVDRVQGARDEDLPHAIRCKALYDAAVVVERMRLRRDGYFMPHGLPIGLGGGAATVTSSPDDRKYEMPGGLELEMACAGLALDDEGEPSDPAKVQLLGSEALFDVWDEAAKDFVPFVVPEYVFGRLHYPSTGLPTAYIPGLRVQMLSEVEVGEEDDSLFSFARREEAGREGFVQLRSWEKLREARMKALVDDGMQETLAQAQPDFASMRDLVQSGSYASASSLIAQARTWAQQDVATLRAGIALLEDEDPEDEALPFLAQLQALVEAEVGALAAARNKITGSVTTAERQTALQLLSQAPSGPVLDLHAAPVRAYLDEEVDGRIAYPDGPLRGLRALEQGLLRLWRGKGAWFDLRRVRQLEPRMRGYLGVFERNLSSLVNDGATLLIDSLVGATLQAPVASGADKLALAGPARELKRLRSGQLAVLGGARPALAVILGHGRAPGGVQRLQILPLRVSQAAGLGLDGIPGLVQAQAPLRRTLSGPLTGDELRRGMRANEPEADGLPQEVVALWSRLKLMRGPHFALSLPSPFDAQLELPVHATAQQPLPARAPKLVLPTGPYDASTDPPRPLFATPGEILLLRGRDADGLWWQAAVEASSAQVTTMEALGAVPERDPNSPICCEPKTPVVLVALSMNSMPVELMDHVSLHRGFVGFGWPGLVIGKPLPRRIDPETALIAAEQSAGQFHFVEQDHGDLVDRGPELEAAAQVLNRLLGGFQ